MRRRRRYPCWWFAPLAALPLLALATCVPGKRVVDGALERDARRALTDAGVADVDVDFDWGEGVLTGAPELEQVALLVVGAEVDDAKRYGLRYVADASRSTTTTTAPGAPTSATPTTVATGAPTTPAPTTAAPTTGATTIAGTTTVAPATAPPATAAAGGVAATATVAGNRITLEGDVATESVRTAIVAAASGAFGASKVDDRLTVAGGAEPTGAGADAVDRYATLLGAAGPRLSEGTVAIASATITLTGTGFNPQAVSELDAAVAQANGGGVSVTGTFRAAAADLGALPDQLRALLGRSGINFASGSATIDDASQAVLDTAAASIVALPGVRLAIEGHTDDVGSPDANLTLSQQRADAVLTYLVARDVPADQLTATGFGPDRPIADNGTAEGRAANRRIEFAVLGS